LVIYKAVLEMWSTETEQCPWVQEAFCKGAYDMWWY